MINCRHCGSSSLKKNGKNSCGSQRYRCKDCSKTFCLVDKRLKHSPQKRLKVMKMYLEGVGIRSIERLESVSNVLILYWIRKFSDIIRKEISAIKIPEDSRDIEILELDELFSYVKKNSKECMYGLLLTETGTKLLKLK